ncbi:MAG: hypothetical protein CSB33_04375 [Desulfobacterales bacterium]|nr:MAG: hypothetical protein CSB33_04375 [Desulfobacterales bacterium]
MMKYKDDPWLTDYLNSIHFTIRTIEVHTGSRRALLDLKHETDALVREAILGHLPMDVYTIRRVSSRIDEAEQHLRRRALPRRSRKPRPAGPRFSSYKGDTRSLVADYRFLQQGFEEFSLAGMIAECRLYLPKIYITLTDLDAVVTELFQREIERNRIREIRPGVFAHTPPE